MKEMEQKKRTGGFGKDFTLVIIGQIISLFGNQILRYALPLYLLNQTGSAFLFGLTMALSFIPMLLMSPIGGIIADRKNKRNIMVGLDFFTAVLMVVYGMSYQKLSIVVLTIVVLMILYGIQGLYQPTVQASVPLLVPKEQLMQGNAMINMVSSLAGILGPVLGGIAFAKLGIGAIIIVSIACFVSSAIMELFIRIPYIKRDETGSVMEIVRSDMKESIVFVRKERAEIGKVGVLLLVINAVFSALIVVGLPILIHNTLGLEEQLSNTLYGYAQGALALGGLMGGMLSGIMGKKCKIQKGGLLLLGCTLTILPITLALLFQMNAYFTYGVIVVCCVLMMIFSTILTIMLITYVQKVTPEHLLGKVMALLTCLVMCGHPIGQLVYGWVLELLQGRVYIVFAVAFLLAIVITMIGHHIFKKLEEV